MKNLQKKKQGKKFDLIRNDKNKEKGMIRLIKKE